MMKTVTALAFALVGCVDSPTPPDTSIRIEDKCGQDAQIPPMPASAVTVATGDPTHVVIDVRPWNDQVTWTVAITKWAGCVEPIAGADITAACGASPRLPAWSYLPISGDTGHVLVGTKVWADHMAWSDSMASWSDCVEPMIEAQPH